MAYNADDMALDPELVELAAGNKGKKEGEEEGDAEETRAEAPREEPRVLCFISRKEIPVSETVELKYREKDVRVSKKLVKFPI